MDGGQGSVFLGVSWNATHLIISAGRSGHLEIDECATPFTLPPTSLADWARRQSLIPILDLRERAKFPRYPSKRPPISLREDF